MNLGANLRPVAVGESRRSRVAGGNGRRAGSCAVYSSPGSQRPGGAGATAGAGRRRIGRPDTRNGYHVCTATTPADALRHASDLTEPVDLLLTDVIMPDMLGTEVSANVRSVRPGLPVSYMSGYAKSILDTQGALRADINVLEKPFSENDLLTRVRQAIDEGARPAERGPGSGARGQ